MRISNPAGARWRAPARSYVVTSRRAGRSKFGILRRRMGCTRSKTHREQGSDAMSATAHLPQIAKIASIPKPAAYETITATPASPHIGAEIGPIDLTKPLTNKEVEELHDAFARYQVIFFRNQKISFEDQIR